MNRLTHPATLFLQAIPFTQMALRDMTRYQQEAVFRYMSADGDGLWGEFHDVDEVTERFGDIVFMVGKFANDDTMKIAFAMATDGADYDSPLEWFVEAANCDGEPKGDPLPVIVSHPNLAPEFGLFEWGYEWFWDYWCYQPETECIRCVDGWDSEDPTGRGGQ